MSVKQWNRRSFLRTAVAGSSAMVAVSALGLDVAWAGTASAADTGGADPLPLPDTDRAKAVKAWMTGGRAVRAGAAEALVGSDADIRAFLTEQLPKASVEDNRVAILTYLARAGKGLRREALAALNNGDAAIADFLTTGFDPALTEDLRVTTATVMGTGGKAITRDGTAALNAGERKALEDFLVEGQYEARLEDMRVLIAGMLAKSGPEVRKYAGRALGGSAADVQWFLDTGQHIARARDQESATIEELVAVVEREGKRAQAETDLAVEASERAKAAAEKAKEAAEKAAAEAAAAQDDVEKSGEAARKAASAAKGAADAARNAINASHAAVAASRRASFAATAASQCAATAGYAASRAYRAAIGASKDASQAQAAKDAAVAARNAAAKARTAAKAADYAATASAQAAGAGSAAASAARNAAAAAGASAQAAAAAGAAQQQAAEAKRQASIASAAANRATNAASTAQALANSAATSARTARDAANSAADHAEKAADAADEAVKYAGQALDYANKSTAHAAKAVAAANTATKTVEEALAVEQAARDAELASLEEDKQQGLDEAAELARIEADERAEYEDKRAQAEQTEQAVRDLISDAERALAGDDLTLAATLGRKAAVGLLSATGSWTRQAAQFALCGTDADAHAWIDTDRSLAQGQDDRETALYLAQVSAPAIAEAAHTALGSDQPGAARAFLTEGVIEAAATDNRVQVFRVLANSPGRAVKAAAEAAIEANDAKALQDFFEHTYADAIREDDSVATATLLAKGGPYTKAHAEVALAGPTWMRRNFIDVAQYKTAQLDYDSATHVAAIRGAIAAAAKIAHKAQQDAALASKAAAEARQAAAEAAQWATKAQASADKADDYADQARKNADDADKSAAAAQASANTAKAAAATARGASRSANYSANRAIDAARSALNSAYSAQASASSARQSALAAGKDAQTAAAAASDARRIATEKRQIEAAEAARRAAEQAKKDRENGNNPSDSPTHDKVNKKGSDGDGEGEDWWEDAGWYANAFNNISIATGFISAGLGLGSLLFPPLAPFAAGFAWVSLATAGLSTVFTGIEYGIFNGKFASSAAGTALALVTFGQSKWIGALSEVGGTVVAPVATKVTQFAHDLVSPITGVLSLF